MITEIKRIYNFGTSWSDYLKELERDTIQLAMKATNNDGTKAAKLLKMNRTTLVMKRKKYGLMKESGK